MFGHTELSAARVDSGDELRPLCLHGKHLPTASAPSLAYDLFLLK